MAAAEIASIVYSQKSTSWLVLDDYEYRKEKLPFPAHLSPAARAD
jgi:hypothetical protein